MFGLFRKRQLRSRVLILSALPENRDEFDRLYQEKSDFVFSLCRGERRLDELWRTYKASAEALHSTLKAAEGRGVTVVRSFSLADLKRVGEYDAVIVLAHHSDDSDQIEIGGEMVRTQAFVDAFPRDVSLYIDLTSCYSSYLIPKLKGRLPTSRIIGIDVATSLNFRLFLLDLVLRQWVGHPDYDYLQALQAALSSIPDFQGNAVSGGDDGAVKLGGKLQSTVYAPNQVRKGEDFMVSVFLHKPEESEEVTLMARSMDQDAELKGMRRLSIKIKKGDRVDFQFTVSEHLSSSFKVDKPVKGFVWDGDINDVEFVVSVSERCTVASFVGKILVFVNKEPVGDMVFKTAVVSGPVPEQNSCAAIDFVPYDKEKDTMDARSFLLHSLDKRISQIQEQAVGNVVDESLQDDLAMCRKCRDLLSSPVHQQMKGPLRVFISSTSDMKEYREVIRERVEACEMYPDMYENWGQGDNYPRDVCCLHVLNSDIFVCVLGSKYGFVEPIWNKSMTEIEYRVAQTAGIPILVYLAADYKEGIERLEDRDRQLAVRQKQFIEEVKNKRLVGVFPNRMTLSLLAGSDLLTVKYSK